MSGWFEPTADGLANANYSIAQSPDGTVTGRYDKVRLVPFGEFVPLRSFIENFSDEIPGATFARAPARNPRDRHRHARHFDLVGGLLDHRARDAIGNGGQLLLNPTNGSSYWLTIVRASRSPRAASEQSKPTDSCFKQRPPASPGHRPRWRGAAAHGVSEQKVLYDTVELRTGRTLSVQLGAWPMLVYGIATLAVIQGRRRFQKVGESDLDPQGDGTIVHELDGHIGTEPAGGDDRAAPRNASTTVSTNGSACSGRAASL